MNSNRFTLNQEDLKKVATNALIFSAPALLAFFTTLQATGSLKMAGVALYTWSLSTVVDLLRKFTEGK